MMSVRTKTLLIVGAVLTGLIVLLYAVSNFLLVSSYEALEVRESQQNMQRILNATQDQLNQLTLVAIDWARWDDVRDFILEPNEAFIEANLMDATYLHQEFNYSAFVTLDGEFVHEKMVDLDLESPIPVPDDLQQHFALEQPLMQHNGNPYSEIQGVITLENGIMFVVSLPVTNSQAQQPINGYMIWGRYLSDSIVAHIVALTGFDVTMLPYNTAMPPELEAAKPLLTDGVIHVDPINADTVATYTLINDVYGEPAIMLQVQSPRTIVQLGRQNWNYFLLSMALLGISAIVVVLLLLERVVLSRLSRLNSSMALVGNSGNTNIPIDTHGNDELAHLGKTIRQMLDTLGKSRTTLQEAHDTLDVRVQERTAELATVNRQLMLEVAERKVAQEALAVARDQALEALRLKTEILANVSHDARTPLNIVTLNTEMLLRGRGGALNERGTRMLDNILINAQQLLNFHNNLLGEAQLGHTKVKLQRQPVDISKLLQDIANLTQPLAERKGLAFCTEQADELVLFADKIIGDSDRLKQMVVNLVDNAVKFTDSGSITIAARIQDEQHWALDVIDTGSGIPEAAQPRIFEAFYQVDGSVTRSANRGVGLGLSIVKQLANLMGSTIQIKSALGSGTTFTISIPFKQESIDEHSDAA